jgi:hypothetical protein
MNVIPKLTDREQAEIRKRVLCEEIKDVLQVLDAMNWSHAWHTALVERDALALLEKSTRRVYE